MFKLKNIKKNDLMKYAKLKPKCFHSSALLNMKMYDRKKNEMGSKIKMMNNNMINNNILRNKTYRCGYDNNDNAYNYVSIRRYALEGPPKIKFTKDDDKKKGWISTTITKTMKYIPEWKTVKIKLKNLPEVIKEELIHYYKGFKLLFKNMKLSSQLVLRILKGEKLKRSESALLERTVADTFRLVPFIIILVVPFMEFTLPVLLKLFPNMLPSTFTTKDQKQQKIEKQIHARLGLAKFLQGATEKLLLEELKGGVSEEDFLKFTKKIKNGEYISNDEIINFGRVFKDKFELNNLSVERVQALCEFFGISKLGPRSFLLFQLDSKLKSLKNDDEQILSQGTEGLSMEELVQINMQRGMKIEGRNRAMLVKQLYDWIQLSTNKEVPKFLLLLSRSFSVNQGSAAISAAINQLSIEEIEDIIKDLPDEAEEFQKRIDELNEIQKEKKREEKEKKEQEELKRKEEEKKKKEEEELKRKLDEEEREKQRLLQEEEKKKKAEEDEKRKLEEEEKKRLEAEKLRIQEEEKTKQQQTQPETKQVEEEKKGDLKTELGEVESEQKFIHQLEERTHSPQSEKLTDKVEEIIEKSKQQIENLEKEVKEKEEEEKVKKERETVVVETVVTVETDKEVKDDEVAIENLETLKDQEEYDTQQRLEEDTELLDKELETVSVDQKFIQQLEEKAQVKEVEMLTDKIEEMIERSKAELEKLQKSSSSPTKKDDEKKVDEEKKEDDV